MPQVSVIVPAFIRSPEELAFLHETLTSILGQTITPYELLVVDDGSPITFPEFTSPLIRLIHNDHNLGIGGTRQRGADEAQGEYIAYLSSDDLWVPTFLEESLAFADATHATFSNYWHWYFKDDEKELFTEMPEAAITTGHFREEAIQWALRKNMFVMVSAVLIPTEWFRIVQFPREQRYGEDLTFLLDTLINNLSWRYVPKPLAYYRIHSRQASVYRAPDTYITSWQYFIDRLRQLDVPESTIQDAYRAWYRRAFPPLSQRILRKIWRTLR